MRPVKNNDKGMVICPKYKTCRNCHIWPDGRGQQCLHGIPHLPAYNCKAGVCGVEATEACQEV